MRSTTPVWDMSCQLDEVLETTERLLKICRQINPSDPLLAYDLRNAIEECEQAVDNAEA